MSERSVPHWTDAKVSTFAVIGFPIGHSLSPLMQSAALQVLGMDATYQAIEVAADEFEDALNRLQEIGICGINVTIPHKESAFQWCKEHDSFAQKLQVVNTIDLRSNHGWNTDAPGFGRTLDLWEFNFGRALVLGAGGSARSILWELQNRNIETTIWNRTPERAADLVRQLNVNATCNEASNLHDLPLHSFDLIVNCTSQGLYGELPNLDWKSAEKCQLMYDLAYSAELTPFLKTAQERGFNIQDGRQMLVEQGLLSLMHWTQNEIQWTAELESEVRVVMQLAIGA